MTAETPPASRELTRSTIIDAAARLLRQGGLPAATTRAVAEAAGVPTPTIFRLFGDKDGLLDAVAERVMAGYVADKTARASAQEGDPVEELRAAWRGHVDFGLANPDLFVRLASPASRGPSAAVDAGLAVLSDRVERLAIAGRLRVSQDRAVDMIHAAGTGVTLALLARHDGADDLTLAEATFEAILDAILTAGASAADPELPALAVAFAAAVPRLPALTAAERGILREWLDRAIAELER